MKKPSKTKRAVQFEQAAPPVSAIESLGKNLYYQFLHGLAGTAPAATGNATDMAKALVDKAKGGNVSALRLAVDVMQYAAGISQQGGRTSVVVNDNRGQVFLSDVRLNIVAVMLKEGTTKPLDLAEKLRVTSDIVNAALVDHDWFEKHSDGWHLTAKAVAEAGPLLGA